MQKVLITKYTGQENVALVTDEVMAQNELYLSMSQNSLPICLVDDYVKFQKTKSV